MDERVCAAQFSALYRQGRITNLASPIIAATVGYMLLSEISGSSIFIWLAFVALATVARGVVHHRFERSISARGTVSSSTKLAFLISIRLSGLAWGGGMPFLFPVENLALQVFLIVVVLYQVPLITTDAPIHGVRST